MTRMSCFIFLYFNCAHTHSVNLRITEYYYGPHQHQDQIDLTQIHTNQLTRQSESLLN